MRPTGWILLGIVLITLAAGSWWSSRQRIASTNQTTVRPQSESNDNTAKPNEQSPTTVNPGGQSRTSVSVTTNGNVTHAASITLRSVGNASGSGNATRTYDGTTFTHTVSASLPDPAAGKFYEGWLVQADKKTFISTGALTKDGVAYVLTFSDQSDRRDYPLVVITEETTANGTDNTPETHVLEGAFTNAN